MELFKKTNANGTPKTCRFCHAPVWWHLIECRWYDVDGLVLHVENCQLGAEFYHGQNLDTAETKRSRKPR